MFSVGLGVAANKSAGSRRAEPIEQARPQNAFAAAALASDHQNTASAYLALMGQKTS